MSTVKEHVRNESKVPEWCQLCGHKILLWQEHNKKLTHMRMIPCTEYERLKKIEQEHNNAT